MSDEGEESPARPRRRIKRVMVVSSASSSGSEDSGPTTSTRRRRLRVLSDAGSDTSSGSSVVCGVRRRRGALPQLRDSDGDSDTSGWATDHSDAPKPASKSTQDVPKPSSGFASDSSEGNSDKCSICLMRFTEQQVGTPATCEHIFCLDCIKEWSKNVNTCPVDRISFDSIVVRTCVGGRVLRNEPVKVVERPSSVDMMFVEDPTVCEICGSSSSEETMLLCDGCDLGYHMECLTPPLTEVPVDQWLCPNCDGLFDVIHLSEVNDLFSEIGDVDLDSLGPRPSALRAERTVRRSQRRQPPADQPSTSSGRRSSGPAADRLAMTRSAPRRRPAATTHRTHRRKHKRRRTKTVIIEYEVQENGKFAVTKTIKRRVKKRKTRTRRARTAARRTQVRASVRAQLASLRAGTLANGRSELGAGVALPTLSLFGSRDQLEYFSDEEQSVDVGPAAAADVGVSVALASRPTPAVFSAYRQARRKMLRVPSPSPASVAPDLVSSILESQTLLHSRRAVASVAPGGALRIELRPTPARREVRSTDPVPAPAPRESPPHRLDLTGRDESTRQAPAYPGGGRSGGGGWGGGYRGTYHREQTANSYARGGYGGYPPARQPPPLYRRNGGHPDDFEGGGYGPPPRRGPPFLPGDAPYERRRSDAGRGRAPWAPRPEQPSRHSFGGFESSSGPAPAPPSYPPLREPPPFHFEKPPDVDEGNGGRGGGGGGGGGGGCEGGDKSEDERSDPDLVIDTEKYDPTEPTNDDDDVGPDTEEHPKPTIVDASYASPEPSCDDPPSPPLPPPLPAPPSASVLDSAVRAVLEEHRLLAPAPMAPSSQRAASDDDEDGEEDGDCPNFSIYSATSVHIASTATAASCEEPRDLNSERVTRRCPITVNPRNPIKIKLNAPSLIKRHVSLYDDEDALPEELDVPVVAPAPPPPGGKDLAVDLVEPASESSQREATLSPPPAAPPTPPTPPTPADRDPDPDNDVDKVEGDTEEKEGEEDEEEEEKEREASRSRSPSVGSSPRSPGRRRASSPALEKMTESISEETEDERSYTPCLDENTGLEGLDTELISEDEAPGFSAVDEDDRDPGQAELGREPAQAELDPEPGVTPPHETAAAGDDDAQPVKKKRKKERGVRGERKPKRELTFKKIGKSGKERTYRERDKKRDRRESSESRVSRVSRRRRDKRKDLERYDVRTVVGDKRRRVKDAFGRDVSPPRGTAGGAGPSPARSSPSPRRRQSMSPRRRPTASPRRRPSISPRRRPSLSPRRRPSMSPRRRPSLSPRRRPSMSPRKRPSVSPRRRPSISPRRRPSMSPRRRPSMSPRRRPSMSPRRRPSLSPRRRPSISPRRRPSLSPRKRPSMSPRRRISISPRRRMSGSPAPAARRRPSGSPALRRRISVSPVRSGAGSPARRSPSPRRRRRGADGAPSRPKRRRVSGTRARKRRRSISPEPSPKPKAKKKKRARSEQRRRTPRRRRRPLGGSGAGSPPPPPHGWAERPPSPRTPPAAPPPPAPRRLDRVKHRRARDSAGPSKEVFTSGDNILVSVSFKDQEESAARRERRRERRRRRRAAVESELTAVKPVAIIDLERSPFRELTPSPKNVIVLSDDEGREAPPCGPGGGPHAAPVAASPQGPKTPPSPRVAPDPAPAQGSARAPSPAPAAGAPGRGPNTPPSPPDSPDAYDPYEPTRSRSGSRSPRGGREPPGASSPAPPPAPGDRPSMTLETAQKTNLSADEVLDRRPLEPMEKVLALLASTRDVSPDPPPPSRGSDPPLGPPAQVPLDTPALGPPAPQPPKLFLAKPSPIKSDPIKPMQQATKISRLPLPLPVVPLAEADSPYSPGSSDFGELFEPPAPPSSLGLAPASAPALAPRDAFDVLFDKPRNRKRPSAKVTPKPKPSKKGKAVVDVRLDDDSLKVLEELPSSAVEMQVKSKVSDFLKKLNRQERVVEEVKLVLKPHYNKKHVTKEEYKHILRRAVPKICHNKTGEINPTKIQALVEAYVKKFRKKRKLGLP